MQQSIVTDFQSLEIPVGLKKALQEMKYQVPTPIQAQAIPVALQRKDVLGCAQTGTGKTAAFCIPMLTVLEKNPGKIALILVPTREIAQQIMVVLQSLLKYQPKIRSMLLIGGASMGAQHREIAKRPQVIVATPGRLVDHLRRKTISLMQTEILVLDEADRMLDMGFAPQLNVILQCLPRTPRQTLFFSATFPADIQRLAARYLKDPVKVTVGQVSQAAAQVSQSVVHAQVGTKNDVLLDELNARKGAVIIFARTKRRTDKLARFLAEYGHPVSRIHGDRTLAQRNAALEGVRAGRFRILVATDVAARGIDIPQIAHVINYDLPQVPDDYIHRIGRTARAGAEGQALSILTPEDRLQWREITRLLEKTGSARFAGARA